MKVEHAQAVQLPEPALRGRTSLEQAIRKRRSVRDYTPEALTLAELSQLLWSAQGVTGEEGLRSAPSAGALYPLETHVAVGKVEELAAGVYRYHPEVHRLSEVRAGDVRKELARAALKQACIEQGAVVIVLAAVYERTTSEYGEEGESYVHMEVGHVGQNVHLQAVALGLGTVMVAAFDEERVQGLLDLPAEERPLYLMPVGRPR